MSATSQRRLFVPLAVMLIAAAWLILWVWDSSPYARYLHHVDWCETGLAGLCSVATAGLTVIPAVLHTAAWLLMIVARLLPTMRQLLQVFGRLTAARAERWSRALSDVLG